MTEQRLQEIEAELVAWRDACARWHESTLLERHAGELVAEVRRLRGLVTHCAAAMREWSLPPIPGEEWREICEIAMGYMPTAKENASDE